MDVSKASKETILKKLGSSINGLSEDEVKKRLNKYGKNEFKKSKGWTKILIKEFSSPLIILLLIVSLLYFFIGDKESSILIISLILISQTLSFYQEYKANKSFIRIQRMIKRKVKVIRNGKIEDIDPKLLVPGDIIILKAGDIAPADLRLIEGRLTVNQSIITGESKDVNKTPTRDNIIYSNSWITYGEATCVVVSTGERTYVGKIKKEIKVGETTFSKQIKQISKIIAYLVGIIVSTIFIFDVFVYGINNILKLILFAIAVAIGIVPEVLPAVITIALSNGARILSKRDVIVRRLSSIEDLGNIDTLCIDKTGTITEGKEEVFDFVGNKKFLNSCAYEENKLDLMISKKFNQEKVKVIKKIPFDPFRKIGSVIIEKGGVRYLVSKGAPEEINKRCKKPNFEYKKYNSRYRIVSLAYKKIKKKKSYGKTDEKDLNYLGMFLIEDPIKKTVKEAFKLAKNLGVKIKVLTGDDPAITKETLRRMGINEEIWVGDTNNKELIEKYNVFARVTPKGKLEIIRKLIENGHSVGFLGDGINDSPALQVSSVGITVNNACDIAKESSDIILNRKSLYSIIDGIKEGRKIFANIIKYLRYTFVGNFGDLYSVSLLSAILKFLPLLPLQILLVNFLTDLPMMSVSSDNVDKEELKKPNKWNPKEVLSNSMILGGIDSTFDFIFIGSLIYLLNSSINVIRTAWYLEIVFTEILVIFSLRTSKLFLNSKPSKMLVIASIISIAISISLIYLPIGFSKLSPSFILLIFLYSLVYFTVTEAAKLSLKRFKL